MKRLVSLVVLLVALLGGACNRQDTSDCRLARKQLSYLQKVEAEKLEGISTPLPLMLEPIDIAEARVNEYCK